MRSISLRRLAAATGVAAALVLLCAPVGANAAPSGERVLPSVLTKQATSLAELQEQVDTQLKLAPGGKQTAPNEVSYGAGRFVITFAMPGQAQLLAADCPITWFCFYDHVNYGYPRGRLSDPGGQDLAAYGWHNRTESVHNNTSTAVDFDTSSSALLFCVPSYSQDYDVDPYRNQADRVYRYHHFTYC
jgi:hypothetical protein